MYNALSATFNALGDSRTPLGFLIFSSLTNIGLDLWFVIQFHMGVAGVALATLIAQGIARRTFLYASDTQASENAG